MFTPPSVNQIASAYKGNPAPLNAKVDTDRKQNGGIPRDLRQLMAAYDLSQGRQNMGIQQALQIPTNMPTVAEDVQERARQALQARQMQAAQEQMRKDGRPNMVPMGTPRPPMQAQGLNTLESNVGEGYAHGGIIGFSNGGNTPSSGELSGFSGPTPEQEARDEIRAAEQERAKQLAALEQKVAFLRSADAPQAQEAQMQLDALKAGMRPKPSPTDPNFRRVADPRMSGTPAVSSSTPLITSGSRPSAEKASVSANKDNAPMPGGLKDLAGIPSMGAARSYERDRLREDPAKAMADIEAEYNKKVGQRDLSIYDQMAEQLKARKERLNAPKAGYDATMELLEQIASGGGRNWMEAGSRGVAGQRALQKSRLSEQDLLMEKILDLGAKKSDALFAEKKGMFDLTQAEKNRIIKDKQEIAKSLGLSEDKERELIENGIQKELDRKNNLKAAAAGNRDNLMARAAAIRAENKGMTIEESIRRAAIAGGATQMESANVRDTKAYTDAKEKLDARFQHLISDTPYGKKQKELYDTALADLRATHGMAGGINTLPKAQAAALPAKSDLVVGQIYQTAKGPAKWNGTSFEQ
jgi:hypothetical protein